MIEVKVCENNFTHGTEDVITKLVDNYPGVKVVVEACLGHCGECAPGPFVLVNDELIQGDNVAQLSEKVERIIRK